MFYIFYQWNFLNIYNVKDYLKTVVEEGLTTNDNPSCQFRKYPLTRYYNLSHSETQLPIFLREAKYIRGQIPFIINPPNGVRKLCVNTSEWEAVGDHLPLSDGQNPSIISLHPDKRFDSHILEPLEKLYSNDLGSMYLSTLLFGDSQCRWNMTQEHIPMNKISPLIQPPSKRTLILLLDSELNILTSATLYLEGDSLWGTTKRKIFPPSSTRNIRSIVEFDNPKLFFYRKTIHVLYRNGPAFGYDVQVQNPLHFEINKENGKIHIYIKASETFTVCCGRNISFLPQQYSSNNSSLQAMIWIDPLTIIDVDDKKSRRKLSNYNRSGIHGTNGFLVPYGKNEVLGLAHFHRPEGRTSSHYARHGHHYTHAFFTIRFLDSQLYILNRLSNEFVIASRMLGDNKTADIIQFASGLDVINGERILISYGINDCEGGVFFMSKEQLDNILWYVTNNVVQKRIEVGDLMELAYDRTFQSSYFNA